MSTWPPHKKPFKGKFSKFWPLKRFFKPKKLDDSKLYGDEDAALELTTVDSFYSKTSKHEDVWIDPELHDYNPSEPEILECILLRLIGRWEKNEISYYESQTGHSPVMLDLDGKNGYHAPALLIRKYLRLHKQDSKKYPSPFQFERLGVLTENVLSNDKSWANLKQNKKSKQVRGQKSSDPNCPSQQKLDSTLSVSVNNVSIALGNQFVNNWR